MVEISSALKMPQRSLAPKSQERKNMAIQLLHRAQSEPLGAFATVMDHPLKSLGSSIANGINGTGGPNFFLSHSKGQLAKANPFFKCDISWKKKFKHH